MVQYFIWGLMSIFVIWKKGSEKKNLKERGNFFFKCCQSEDVDIKQQNADSSGSGPEAKDVILVKIMMCDRLGGFLLVNQVL